jgi:hypothetical protein
MTSAIVRDDKAGKSVVPHIWLALLLNVGITIAVGTSLFLIVPQLYGFDGEHSHYRLIMAEMTIFSALNGMGYGVIALCNGLGVNGLLVRQNIFSSLTVVFMLFVFHQLRVTSCVWIALVVCLGQLPQIVSFLHVVREALSRRAQTVVSGL